MAGTIRGAIRGALLLLYRGGNDAINDSSHELRSPTTWLGTICSVFNTPFKYARHKKLVTGCRKYDEYNGFTILAPRFRIFNQVISTPHSFDGLKSGCICYFIDIIVAISSAPHQSKD